MLIINQRLTRLKDLARDLEETLEHNDLFAKLMGVCEYHKRWTFEKVMSERQRLEKAENLTKNLN